MESTLRQCTDTPPTTKSSATPTPAPVATLSSSPCVRDVCDAIIVHALRQQDVTPTETLTPSLHVSAQPRPLAHGDSHDPQLYMTDTDIHIIDSKSHLTDHINQYSALQFDQSKSRFTKSNNPQQSSRMTDSSSSRYTANKSPSCLTDYKPAAIDSSQYSLSRLTDSQSCLTSSGLCSPSRLNGSAPSDSVSRLTDSERNATDSPSCVTDDDTQSHLKTKQSKSEVTDPQSLSESCMSDFPSRMTESKSGLSDPHVDQIPSIVVATTTDTAADVSDGGSDDGDMKRSEPTHDADDVDMDDQPLCIDLNRDTSPDADTVGDRQSPLTPHTDTTTY